VTHIKNLIVDVDGVLSASELLYDSTGKKMKVFGPDDHDALNMLRDKLNIVFISGDKRGFEISKRRVVTEMKFELYLVSTLDRIKWIKERFNPKETIFMGDGIFDHVVFKEVAYSICPSDGFYLTKEKADFVTSAPGGKRAVAEACVHILKKFFNQSDIIPNRKYGIWKDKHGK